MYENAIAFVLIFLVAALYSSVGQGGASGYVGVMALIGIAPEIMRPSALIMNIFVASIGTIQFYRAGYFSWTLFLPFAAGSIPLAFTGGRMTLPTAMYGKVVGTILLFASVHLFVSLRKSRYQTVPEKPVNPIAAAIVGGILGLLSGLTGTGGGIFLTPFLLAMHWAHTKRTAAVSSAFIFVNSVAAVAGEPSTMRTMPIDVGYWVIAAMLGGFVGSKVGAKRAEHPALQVVLCLILLAASLKMIYA